MFITKINEPIDFVHHKNKWPVPIHDLHLRSHAKYESANRSPSRLSNWSVEKKRFSAVQFSEWLALNLLVVCLAHSRAIGFRDEPCEASCAKAAGSTRGK